MNRGILIVGLNHKTAPVELREKISFPGNSEGTITQRFMKIPGLEEIMILSTCNRAEVIACVSNLENTPDRVVEMIFSVHDTDRETFENHLYSKLNSDAVTHLFRVASGLDSMVLGEPQILGQVKESYRRAADVNATGPILNRLLHRAFFSAKRVRTETAIGLSAVSVAYVAVELAKKILGDLNDKSVLLIGAGEMAELAAKHLISHVDKPVTVVNRTYENACILADRLQGCAVELEGIYDAVADADVVITSTGSCEPILRSSEMKSVMKKRRYRPVFLIDIAIPRDVDPEVNDLDGVYLYNIDDLQAVVEENIGERKKEALKGEEIVRDETDKYMKWLQSLESTSTIVALRQKLESIRQGELSRLNGKLSKLGPEEREIIEMLTKSIMNKVAHDPITFLKKTSSRSKNSDYVDLTQRLFKLNGLSHDLETTENDILHDETYHSN